VAATSTEADGDDGVATRPFPSGLRRDEVLRGLPPDRDALERVLVDPAREGSGRRPSRPGTIDGSCLLNVDFAR